MLNTHTERATRNAGEVRLFTWIYIYGSVFADFYICMWPIYSSPKKIPHYTCQRMVNNWRHLSPPQTSLSSCGSWPGMKPTMASPSAPWKATLTSSAMLWSLQMDSLLCLELGMAPCACGTSLSKCKGGLQCRGPAQMVENVKGAPEFDKTKNILFFFLLGALLLLSRTLVRCWLIVWTVPSWINKSFSGAFSF